MIFWIVLWWFFYYVFLIIKIDKSFREHYRDVLLVPKFSISILSTWSNKVVYFKKSSSFLGWTKLHTLLQAIRFIPYRYQIYYATKTQSIHKYQCTYKIIQFWYEGATFVFIIFWLYYIASEVLDYNTLFIGWSLRIMKIGKG